jgi:hypothetical protein
MTNVVVLQGAAIPGTDTVFYLQINGEEFTESKDAEIRMSGDVAKYVGTIIQPGLLCVAKGKYVPAGNYIEAESASFLRDRKNIGDTMWE